MHVFIESAPGAWPEVWRTRIFPMNCGANNQHIPNYPKIRTTSNKVSKLTQQKRWGDLHSLAINMAIDAYPTTVGGATIQQHQQMVRLMGCSNVAHVVCEKAEINSRQMKIEIDLPVGQ